MDVNVVLRRIAYEIYKERPVIPQNLTTNYRIEHANGGLLCDLWFLTVGCVHDAQGGCAMCNYGRGSSKVDQAGIIRELERIVKRLPWEFEDFLLTPSGSMLDEREVSCEMREELISVLKDIRAKRFIIETRSDTITDSGIEFVKRVMPEADKYIEIGVESSDDWVLKHCINKGLKFRDFEKAVEKIHANGIFVTANIGLGFPFMSERASVYHTIQSIKDAMRAGADSIVVFPYHVKRGTILDKLYQNGMYQNVSLWALVEVLSHFSQEELQKIQISWYKDYFGEERSYIYRSPGTCPACQNKVMNELDRYRDSQEYASVRRLREFSCQCRDEWKERFLQQEEEIQFDRVESDYRRLAQMYGIEQDILDRELHNMYQEFMRR